MRIYHSRQWGIMFVRFFVASLVVFSGFIATISAQNTDTVSNNLLVPVCGHDHKGENGAIIHVFVPSPLAQYALQDASSGYGDSQSLSSCPNSNFSVGLFTNWSGCYGPWVATGGSPYNPACNNANMPWYNTPTGGRFLIESAGFDNCIPALSKVFPGELHSALIGNRQCTSTGTPGQKIDQLTYPITYDPNHSFFTYRCAVVLADPSAGNHETPDKRPRFTIQIKDHLTGAIIDPVCGAFDLYPGDGVTVWNSHVIGTLTFLWKDWSAVGIDLSQLSNVTAGQLLDVVFMVHGCTPGGHTGYAYISTVCEQMNISMSGCLGSNVVILTAPPGYANYTWTGPICPTCTPVTTTGQTLTVINANAGDIYRLDVVSLYNYPNCQVKNIFNTIIFTVISPGFVASINCAGNPSSFNDTSKLTQNAIVGHKWTYGDGTPVDSTGVNPRSHTFALPGTYTVTLVTFSTEGCSDTISQDIVVGNAPVISNPTQLDRTICSADSAKITPVFVPATANCSWTTSIISGSATIISIPPSHIASEINDQIINTGTIDAVVHYTITPRVGSLCLGTPVTCNVTVHPHPSVICASTQPPVCSGAPTLPTALTSNVLTGVTYTWTAVASPVTLTGFAATGSSATSIPSETITNPGTTQGSVVYTITAHYGTCPGTTNTHTILINPIPHLTTAPMLPVCSGSYTNINLLSDVTATTFTWTASVIAGSVTGATNSAAPGILINDQLVNTGTIDGVVRYVIIPHASGCSGISYNYDVTIHPVAHLTNTAPPSVCSASAFDATLLSDVLGTTFTWTASCMPLGSVTGFSTPQLTGTITISDILTNTTTEPASVTYHTTPTANGCIGVPANLSVTVNPTAVVTSPSTANWCNSISNTYNITSSSATPVPVYSWTRATVPGINPPIGSGTSAAITETLVNSTTDPLVVHYLITPAVYGCDGTQKDVSVTVNPTAVITSAATVNWCNGIPNTYNITSSSTAPAPSYAWTRAAVPGITNLAGSGAGSAITETLINTTVNPVVVHYLITPTVNSCAGTLFDVSVTVNPTSVITSAATANWCSNVANTYNILSSSTTPTPVFTWTRAVVPGITNLAGSGTGATITETLVNSTADPVVVHYLITPTTNGCDGITKDVSVTVNPTSVITSPASISRCNNVPGTYSITSSSITPTPSYAWTRAVVPGITNAAGAGAGAFITETLVNSTTDPVIAIYVITPTVNACSGTPYNVAVTVNPTAVITSPATGNWANNVLNTYVITSSSTTPAPTYTWTRAAMPGITPATGSGTGAVITETLSNSTTDPIIVHYLIIPSVNGCPGTTYDVAVTVNPTSSITSPASANWCNNTANTYTITSSTTPTPAFTWTRDPVPGISNPAGSGTGAIITETLVNTTTDPVVVFYVIIPWAGGFPGTQYNVAVTVNPTAVVTSVATANWCSNVPNTYNILSSTTPTPAFSWTRALVPGITPATGAGTGSIITETLTNSSTDPVTTDYIITPTINSCVGTPKTVTVTMNPTSVITSPSTANWCNGIPNTYNITSSSTAPSPTYAWTRGTVPGITNLAGAGAGASITETLVNSTTDPIIVHYMITPTVNGCNGTLYDVSVTVNPTAIITSPPTANWCNSQPNTYNISSSTTPTPVFTWSRAAVPGISNAANAGSGASITETLVNTTIDPVVVTYVITPTINNCAGTSISVLVTVNPTAVITSASTANWCNNVSNTYNITSSSTTPPPAYTWTRAAVPGILNTPGSGAGASITETLQNSTTDPVLVTYIITPAVNGCSGTPKNISVTVNPTAVVTSASTVSWCNNVSNTYNILSSSTTPTPVFSWTRAVVPGITNLAGSGTGASITETLINSTTSPVAVIYVITPAVNGCNGTPKNVTVTVNPTPHLTNGPPAPICSGTSFNVALLPDVTGGNFSWTASCLPLGSVTGFTTPQLTNVTAINDVLTNSTATFATVTYHITPHANGCDGAPVDYSVTINPTPHLTNSPPAAICSGTNFNIALLPDVLGGNFTWTASCLPVGSVTGFTTPQVANVTTINDVLTNLTTAPATVTYHITPHANGCNGILTDFTVTVNPTPHLMNAPPSPVCSGNNFSIALLPDVSGGNFTWTASCSPVGSVTGFTTPQLTNVTGINDVLTNITTAPATVTYHITPHANGCAGISTDFTVTVNPTPHLTNSPPPAICSGTTFSVALLPDVLGGNFTWTASCLPAGSVTGFTTPQLINVTDINDLLTNTTTAPATVTYHITPHANGCSGTSTDYTVTVNPTPHLMNAPPAPICSGSTFNVALLPDVSGGNFSWTATCSPAGSVTGFTTPQVGYVTVINDLLTNVTTAPATVTYHITPHANNCAGIPVDFTVTVNPTPHLMNPQPPTICSGTTLSIPLLPDVTGGNFTWNATCLPVGTVTGFTASQVTGTTMITDLLTNTGNVVSTVTYVITPHANGCAGVQANLAVPVNPVPVISCLPTQSICSGTAFAAVALSSTVTGTDYSWSAACPVGSVNPCPIAPGIANPITPVTLLNVTNIQQTVTYTITSAFQGCPGNSTTHAITVNPSPTVTNWPLEQTICSGQTSAAVNLTATVTGTTFTWTASTASPITGFALSGTSQIPAQTLSIPPAFTGFVTYHVIPSFTGGPSCPGAPTDYKINVNPLPVPAITGLNQVCELQPNVTYTTPAIPGHSYNWNITGATAISGANTNTVTVTWGAYTLSPGTLTVTETIDATGCLQTTSVFSVTIFQRPIPTITGPLSACNTSTGNVYSTEAGMNNYTWTIAGGSITSGGGTGSPTATVTWNSAGTQWIQVNYINAMGCPGFPAKTLTITVNPLPNPAITEGPGPNCESLQHTYLAVPDPACSFLWSITPAGRGMITSGQGQNTVTVDWLTSGPATIGMTATNGTTNCLATGSHLLTVHPKPVPIFNVPCFDLITTPGSKKIILRGGTPVVAGQGVYSGNRVSLNGVSGNYEFDPFGASPGNYFITYTFTNNFGCPAATAPVSINVVNNFFSCGGDLTDIRDSKKYKTTMLSGRCWMKENLTYGTSLSSPSGPVQTDNCLPEKYCGPSDVNCTQYGGMYQWDEVMDYASAPGSKGICPPEWHVPTEAEWQSLIDNLMTGIGAPIANALTGSMLRDPIVTGSFMSLLGGLYYNDNDWAFTTGTNTATQYWTSTVLDATHAIARGLNIHTPSVSKYPSSRSNAFSIRCVKD